MWLKDWVVEYMTLEKPYIRTGRVDIDNGIHDVVYDGMPSFSFSCTGVGGGGGEDGTSLLTKGSCSSVMVTYRVSSCHHRWYGAVLWYVG